ncbi:type II secretion system protein N [Ferrimonas aestuarii]|uniref:Type II secretion system protein N n=1 Tax=Ferrimonas aestuarii TaxID=2569539 RepID=A0A4U1BPR9_9GAMM|nr:type II secretion system protein N [Ferrimonas aestuarii]TKB56218.1 type II secretion system protein N [Ferrimonas aestuarii]
MKWLKYGVGAVALYLVFLVVTVPASLVWNWAPKPNGIKLDGISGNLWQGRVQAASIAGRQFNDLTWELQPAALLSAKVRANVTLAGDIQGRGVVEYGLSGLSVENLKLDSDAGTLLGKRRLPFRTQVAAEIQLNLSDAAQGTPWCERLNGRLTLLGLNVNNQFGQFELGNLAGQLSCQQGNIQLAMTERDNRIGVAGNLVLKANNQVEVNAGIRETAQQPEMLKKNLSFLGNQDANGVYPITYSGRIPGM